MPNTIAESLKTQLYFNPALNNSDSLLSILPSTDTPLKQALTLKYPTAVISSYLEIKLLELKIRITSIPEWIPPDSSLNGTSPPVEQNRDLVRSLWDGARKQMNIYHKLGSAPVRQRGSISLLNKSDVYLYSLEDFLGILTNQSVYPLTPGEDIFMGLSDSGYGFLQGTDELLFTGIFSHYITVTNDSYLNNNGNLLEFATFDQAQAIINTLGNGLNVDISTVAKSSELTPLINSLATIETNLNTLLANGGGGSGNSQTITKSYNQSLPDDDLIGYLGTSGGTVAYANPSGTKVFIIASSTGGGTAPANLLNRLTDYWYSDNAPNQWILLNTNNPAYEIALSGVGLQNFPQATQVTVSIVIEGSLDGINWTLIEQWNPIGFSAAGEWKYKTFALSSFYSSIRIKSTGADSSGSSNIFGLSEIKLYGALRNG